MPYTVIVQPAAERAIAKLSRKLQARVQAALTRLQAEPRGPGTTKMAGELHPYRVRVGKYRVLFDVFDDTRRVIVWAVGPREHVYDQIR
jgi:mRNA interferase RelE/StbE